MQDIFESETCGQTHNFPIVNFVQGEHRVSTDMYATHKQKGTETGVNRITANRAEEDPVLHCVVEANP